MKYKIKYTEYYSQIQMKTTGCSIKNLHGTTENKNLCF